MKKGHAWTLYHLVALAFIFLAVECRKPSLAGFFEPTKLDATALFELKKGDILVRSNWGWLPGSCDSPTGKKFGHVAIVTKGATGKTPDEALEASMVVEALFFDQGTRSFQFQKKDQIRSCNALVSFGTRFKGNRYRLRMQLTEKQVADILQFLMNQVHGGYSLISFKKQFESQAERQSALLELKPQRWQCASLAWEAFYLATNLDIDANQGYTTYPNDILACKFFDLPDGRIRF